MMKNRYYIPFLASVAALSGGHVAAQSSVFGKEDRQMAKKSASAGNSIHFEDYRTRASLREALLDRFPVTSSAAALRDFLERSGARYVSSPSTRKEIETITVFSVG